jgi:hypothetical protein
MKSSSRALPNLEKDLQEACARVLELDGWRRLRTDPVSRREWGKGFGEPGMADDLFIRYLFTVESWQAEYSGFDRSTAEVLWVEWKRLRPSKRGYTWGKATKAAIHQQAWHALERKRGALTLIAGEDFQATTDGFIAWYRESGLMRNKIVNRDILRPVTNPIG